MKSLKVLLIAALMACGAPASAAESDPPAVAGRLSYISGPVSFAPAQANEDWSAAVLNRPITNGDRLWTDTNGRAEMTVGSLALRLGAKTSLDVLVLDESKFQTRLAQGSLNLRVRRLSSDKVLEVSTPGGAVVVQQPGAYRVGVDPSGATTVTVRGGGQAEVFTGQSSFLVRDNQHAAIAGGRQDLYAAPAADDLDRWSGERDRRDDRVVSTRYVPEEMTGYQDLDQHGNWRTTRDYGAVWVPSAVPAGWAPYRQGHWAWVAPWGWTWVDRAPWGFAPFHYGRWVYASNHWAWAPGRMVARPVYAPALVAFIGGSNWSVSVGSGPAVGWVPLGYQEVYHPWYRTSPTYVQNVNVTNVTNVTNITNVTNVTNVRHVNRNVPSAVTVVSRENFVAARQADKMALKVNSRQIAAAQATEGSPVETPRRSSLATSKPGPRPPAEVRTRETVSVNRPMAAARDSSREVRREARDDKREARDAARSDDSPRVRVVERAQRVELQASEGKAGGAKPAAAQPAADAQRAQEQKAERRPERAETKGQPQASPEKSAPPPAQRPQPAEASRERAEGARQRAEEQSSPPPAQQTERRAPAPPREVTQRPTFDRDMRQTGPQAGAAAEARPEQRQEREERRTQAPGAARGSDVPQAENRAVPRAPAQAQDPQREQQAREQQVQRQRELQEQQQRAQRLEQQAAGQARQRELQQQQADTSQRDQQREQRRAQRQEQRMQRREQQAQEQQRAPGRAREQEGQRPRELQQQREQRRPQERRPEARS